MSFLSTNLAAWVIVAASVLALVYAQERLNLSKAFHAFLALISLAGATAIVHYLHPWNSSTAWPGAIQAGLVGVSAASFSQLINRPKSRNGA